MVVNGDAAESVSQAATPLGQNNQGRGRDWYRGDFHVHSQRSHGGELTPDQIVEAACEAGLDFIAITEHNTAEGHVDWESRAGDDLLVILGQEVVTETGHWLALGINSGQLIEGRYGVRDDRIDHSVAQVHQAGGVCVVAHPYTPYPSGTFMYPFHGFDTIEVWNGQWSSDLAWQADNETALAEWGRRLASGIHHGRWRPAIGNSDAHLRGQIGTPQTVVLADELGTDALLVAIRAGHCWIAESAGVNLTFVAHARNRTAQVGQRLETGGDDVAVSVEVSGVPSGTVTFHTERGPVHHVDLPREGTASITWTTSAEQSAFVRIEVRHPTHRIAALTNPIVLVRTIVK
jgi:predicted metal-dependent phosphoesterase TrpH